MRELACEANAVASSGVMRPKARKRGPREPSAERRAVMVEKVVSLFRM